MKYDFVMTSKYDFVMTSKCDFVMMSSQYDFVITSKYDFVMTLKYDPVTVRVMRPIIILRLIRRERGLERAKRKREGQPDRQTEGER